MQLASATSTFSGFHRVPAGLAGSMGKHLVDISASSNLILGSVAVYFLTIIGLGLFYSRRAKSSEDFILASHSLSTPFVTGSLAAFLCSLLALVVVSLLTRKTCPPKPIRDADGIDISDTRIFNWS